MKLLPELVLRPALPGALPASAANRESDTIFGVLDDTRNQAFSITRIQLNFP